MVHESRHPHTQSFLLRAVGLPQPFTSLRLFMFLKKIVVAALIAASSIGAAQADLINGSAGVTVLGVTGTPNGSIGLGTTFNFGFSIGSSGVGDLSDITGTSFATLSLTATEGTAVGFNADWGTFAGTVATAIEEHSASQRVVRVTASGIFTPLSGPPDLSAFDPGLMQMTFTANQTGAAGAISANYTISSTPIPAVPEPGSIALMLSGLGLLAATRAVRRKQAA
jgi:hypothetical protein